MEDQKPTMEMFYDIESPNYGAVPSPYYRGLTRNITHGDNDFTEPDNTFNIQPRFFSRFRLWTEPGAQPTAFVGHAKIHFAADSNLEPLRENAGALSRNHGDELRIDVGQADGAAIDIWDDNRYYINDPTDRRITYQAWREHRDYRKRSRVDDSSADMMSETAAALGGQTIGALVANNAASSPFVEFIIMLGLICTLAGISLRGKRRALSVMMSKIGVMATISAVIMSLAAHLPPLIMFTVGPVALLILAAAVGLA